MIGIFLFGLTSAVCFGYVLGYYISARSTRKEVSDALAAKELMNSRLSAQKASYETNKINHQRVIRGKIRDTKTQLSRARDVLDDIEDFIK